MPAWLYTATANGLWVFLLCTVLIGGAAAFVAGKSIAETWRPIWQIPLYMALLAVMVRFLHFALFEEVFLSARNFAVDFLLLLVLAVAGFKSARARQMAIQYAEIER